MNYLAASSEVSLLRIINPTPQSGGELSPTYSSAEAGREGGLKIKIL